MLNKRGNECSNKRDDHGNFHYVYTHTNAPFTECKKRCWIVIQTQWFLKHIFCLFRKKSIIHEIIFHITFSTFVFAGDVPGCFRSMAAPVLIYSWSINIEPNGRYYCNQHCTTTSTYTYFGLKVNSFLNFQPFRWFISVCLSLYLTLSLKYYDLVWYLKRWRSKFENVQSLS